MEYSVENKELVNNKTKKRSSRKEEAEHSFDTKKYDQHLKEQKISDMLKINYMPYAMSVIIARALPDVRDGLKPSQRKVLYTMKNMGLRPGNKSKSANIAGATLRLNPHSDSSCYETMVRMVDKNETLLTPFVEGKGSFGKHYSRDMAYASSRYTEASLSKIGMQLFDGIDKDAIDMVDNYDGTMKEPSVLPVAFPNILANPTLGIAVGFACNICSFNLSELCLATAMHIKKPKDDLLSIMPAPDFATGGYILYDKQEILNIYKNGDGKVRLRSKYRIVHKRNRIEIFEIPYSTTAEAIIERVVDLCKSGTLSEINDIRDDTDKDGLLITIEYKKSCDPQKLINKLFKLTPLEDTYSCNFFVIVDGSPKCLGVYELLDEWIKFRKECVVRMLTFEKKALENKLHLLEGLEKILVDIDKAIKIIKNTEKDEDVVPNLIKGFKVDEVQANYIADIKLRNINKQYILDRTSEISKIKEQIADLAKKIGSEAEIKKIIISELSEIAKKYSPERKSEILYEFEESAYEKETVDNSDSLTVLVSKDGCIKKMNRLTPEAIEEKKKFEDFLVIQNADNNEDLLIFTDKGNVHKSKLALLKKDTDSSVGTYVNALCNFEPDEHFLYLVLTNDYSGNMLIVFEDGHGVMFPIKQYETKQNRKVLVKSFSTLNKPILFDVLFNDEKSVNKNYIAKASNGKALTFKPENICVKSTRTSVGAIFMNLSKGAKITECRECSNLSEKIIKEYSAPKYPNSGKLFK